MGLMLAEVSDGSTPISQMGDGDIGIVTAWPSAIGSAMIGLAVQRHADVLIILGENSGRSFPDILKSTTANAKDCRVRIVQVGDTLVVNKIFSQSRQ